MYDYGGTVLLFSFIQKFEDSHKNIVESNCFSSIHVATNCVVLAFSFVSFFFDTRITPFPFEVSCKLNDVGDVHAFVI